jgi:hypothetical protein
MGLFGLFGKGKKKASESAHPFDEKAQLHSTGRLICPHCGAIQQLRLTDLPADARLVMCASSSCMLAFSAR